MRSVLAGACRGVFGVGLLLLLLLGPPHDASAQAARYTFALRGVALDQALEAFSNTTGAAVAYDPDLVHNQQTYCLVSDVPPEAALRCILQATELDFYRLSSGTYVLTAPAELAPEPGHLTGRVADLKTGAPLPDAHVQLAEADLGTVTNQSGRFTFPPLLPGRYAIRISHVGYRTWQDTLQVSARGETHAEAALRAAPIPATPVVIDGIQLRRSADLLGHGRVDASDPPVGLAASARGAFHQLDALPGVRLNDVTADVHVQGGDAGDHQMRLDGVPVHLPRTTLGLIGPFSTFAVDRIVVEKAGFDATQGSQMGGITHARHTLTTENRVDLQLDPMSLNGRVQFAPSVTGTEKIAAMAAGRVGLWDVYAPRGLRTTLRNWSTLDPFLLDTPAPTSFRSTSNTDWETPPPTAHFSDLHAAARLRLTPLRTLHVSGYRGARQLTGSTWSDLDRLVRQTEEPLPVTVNDNYRWNNLLGQVRYEALVGSRTLLRAQLRGSQYRLDHRYTALDSLSLRPDAAAPEVVGTTVFPLRDDNTVRTVAAEVGVDHAWGPHQLQTGLALNHTESAFVLHGIYPAEASSYTLEMSDAGYQFDTASPSQHIRHTTGQWRLTAFASDRIALTKRLTTRLGMRLTYHPHRATVYAEPRLALRYDRERGPLGPWSVRTAAGLYRQFTHQTDLSVFNAGALLPSVRVWLPLDPSVTVPRAYHLTHEMLAEPFSRIRVRLEGYLKVSPQRLAMHYAPASTMPRTRRLERQQDFLTPVREHAYGGSLSARWNGEHVRLRALYEYSRTTRRSVALFNGRRHPAPWSRPHRVELGADWMPSPHFTVSVRGQGTWKRPWGFRRVYYDYFGHHAATRWQPPFDLGQPGEHVLPPQYQLDVSLAYTRTLGPATLQARLEVLNATNRTNVADWRLTRNNGQWQKAARALPARLPAAALRIRF